MTFEEWMHETHPYGYIKNPQKSVRDAWHARDEEIEELNRQNDMLQGQLLNAKDSIEGIRKATISDCEKEEAWNTTKQTAEEICDILIDQIGTTTPFSDSIQAIKEKFGLEI